MKTFEIHKLQHDMLTGQVNAEYSLAVDGKELHKHKNVFASPQAAKAHIAGIRRDLLLGWLDDYVNHKRKIIEAGKHTAQDRPLQLCDNAIKHFQANRATLGINEVCRLWLKAYSTFKEILPHPNNSSYKSSMENLEAIKTFCETCLSEIA